MGIFDFRRIFGGIDRQMKENSIDRAEKEDRTCQYCGRIYHLNEYPDHFAKMAQFVRDTPFMTFDRLESTLKCINKMAGKHKLCVVDGMKDYDYGMADTILFCPPCVSKVYDEAARIVLDNEKSKKVRK